jgi:hypothetical protein
VELGYRGSGEPLKRDEFESRKKAAENFRLSKRNTTNVLASHGKVLDDFPFLRALAEREEANRSGKLTVNILSFLILNSQSSLFEPRIKKDKKLVDILITLTD